MFGSTVVMKVAKKGYKRYGVPGAVVAGGGTLLGIRFVKRRFSGSDSETDSTTDSPMSDSTTNDTPSTPDSGSTDT